MRSPAATPAPSLVQQTMRRATSPAIWTTPTSKPLSDWMTSAFRSFVLARLVEIGAQELSRLVGDALDEAGDRRAVDVAVEDIHEHGNPHERLRAQPELGGRNRAHDRLDAPVGRADARAQAPSGRRATGSRKKIAIHPARITSNQNSG